MGAANEPQAFDSVGEIHGGVLGSLVGEANCSEKRRKRIDSLEKISAAFVQPR
jgi:hypothetical protein